MEKIRYYRNCPECICSLSYSTKWSCAKAERLKKLCKSCSKSGEKNPQYGNTGEKNPFFNKKHTDESKAKVSKANKNKSKHTQERKDFLKKEMTENNPMAGKSFYDIWLKKYGKEEADKRLMDYKTRKSEKTSGSLNNMYGKPSPQGSGNGWSGWYKNWYFRSIHELSFMIKYIERFNMKWASAESNLYKIAYKDYANKTRNYFPDFIIENKYLIECKPIKLVNSLNVLEKKKAAELFCKKNNLKYKIITPILLSENIIKNMYITGQIKFLPKYENKFKEKFF